jgi:hypothetical protein
MFPTSMMQAALMLRREDLSLATVVLSPLLQCCVLAAFRVAIARCAAPLQWLRARVRTLWAASTRTRTRSYAPYHSPVAPTTTPGDEPVSQAAPPEYRSRRLSRSVAFTAKV